MLLNPEKQSARVETVSGVLSRTFRDDTHPAVSATSHVPYIKHTWLNDIVIQTKDGLMDASKDALKSTSGYFKDLCKSHPSMNRFMFTFVKQENLKSIVDYAHSGYVTISTENVFERYEAGRFFRVPYIEKVCIDFLTTLIHSSCKDSCWVRQGAQRRSMSEIYYRAKVYQDLHFESLVHDPTFLDTTKPQLIELIRGDDVKVSREEVVYEAVIRWTRKDPGTRKRHLPELIPFVRVPLISFDYFMRHIRDEQLVDDTISAPWKLLCEWVYIYHMSDVSIRADKVVLRTSYDLPKAICTVGGTHADRLNIVEAYDIESREWFDFGRRARPTMHRSAVAVYKKLLWVVGGFYVERKDGEPIATNNVDIFNPYTHIWYIGPPLRRARHSFCLAVVGENLYAIGGRCGPTVLESTEVAGQKEWSFFSDMKHARSLSSVAAACGKMYALGGLDHRDHLVPSAEVFDFENGIWSVWFNSQFRIQRGTRAAAIDGFLYVMTGVCTVQLWIFNVASERLGQSEAKPIIGTNYCIVAVDGLLYAMSSTLKNDQHCIMISRYNPKADAWSLWSETVTSKRPFALSLAAMDRVSKPVWRSNPDLPL